MAPPEDAAEKKTVTFVLTFKTAYASESFSTQNVQEAVKEPLEFVGEPVRINGTVRITTRIPPRADPAGMARRLGSLPGVKTVQVE